MRVPLEIGHSFASDGKVCYNQGVVTLIGQEDSYGIVDG